MPKLKPNTILPNDDENIQITAGAEADEDNPILTDADFRKMKPLKQIGRPKSEIKKVPISIRLEPEVVAFFKSTGAGWQSKMNEVLSAYAKTHR